MLTIHSTGKCYTYWELHPAVLVFFSFFAWMLDLSLSQSDVLAVSVVAVTVQLYRLGDSVRAL